MKSTIVLIGFIGVILIFALPWPWQLIGLVGFLSAVFYPLYEPLIERLTK